MKMLRKQKHTNHDWTDNAAEKIAGAGIRLHRMFADGMGKQSSKLSPHRLKIVLLLFCLMAGGFSVYLASEAVFGATQGKTVLEVKSIRVPQHVDRTETETPQTISEELYRALQQYRRSMDSLGVAIRPGLADSIRKLEEIYHSQNN